MTTTPATRTLLAAAMLDGIGPAALRELSAIPDFGQHTIDELAGRMPKLARALRRGDRAWSDALERAEAQFAEADAHGARILSRVDPEYPALLARSEDDPVLLYVKGSLAPRPEHSVAIIGTREPTDHGKLIAERIATFFVDRGWSVVSGLALGCDAAAHRAVLVAKGHTVAVLAHGLQTVAPTQHRALAEEILAGGGALVTEYPFGELPRPYNFARRDLTQAGLARGVVMIQSDREGGSLNAARAAVRYGRWLAVPYPTAKDREAREAKIQANLVLADGTPAEKLELLKARAREPMGDLFGQSVASRLIVLRSRDDYERCLSA